MHWRLAREVARIEKRYPNPLTEKEVFDLFDQFRYIIPAGGPMTGIEQFSSFFIVQLFCYRRWRLRFVRCHY